MAKCVNKETRELCNLEDDECDNERGCELVPDISIAVPALNEIYNIPKLIDSIRRQETTFDFEVVVADNGSTDGTYDWLKDQDDVRVVRVTEKGIAKARNKAVQSSKAPYILQTDADVKLPKNWVEVMGKKLVDDDVDLVSGSVFFESEKTLQKLITSTIYGIVPPIFNKVQQFLPEDLRMIMLSGANLGYSRKLYNKVGGYDETTKWFEDVDFATSSHKSGARSSFVFNAPIKTSSRRFGKSTLSTLSKLGNIGIVSLLKSLGIEQKSDYERVD